MSEKCYIVLMSVLLETIELYMDQRKGRLKELKSKFYCIP